MAQNLDPMIVVLYYLATDGQVELKIVREGALAMRSVWRNS